MKWLKYVKAAFIGTKYLITSYPQQCKATEILQVVGYVLGYSSNGFMNDQPRWSSLPDCVGTKKQ